MTLIFSFGIYSQIYAFPVFVRRSMIVYINIGNLITISIAVYDMSMYKLEQHIYIIWSLLHMKLKRCALYVMVTESLISSYDVDTNMYIKAKCKNRYLIDLNYMPYTLSFSFVVYRTWHMTIFVTITTAIGYQIMHRCCLIAILILALLPYWDRHICYALADNLCHNFINIPFSIAKLP